jgi:hypothetical protein
MEIHLANPYGFDKRPMPGVLGNKSERWLRAYGQVSKFCAKEFQHYSFSNEKPLEIFEVGCFFVPQILPLYVLKSLIE